MQLRDATRSYSILYPGLAPVNDSLRVAGGSHMRRKFAAQAEELRCCGKPQGCFTPSRESPMSLQTSA